MIPLAKYREAGKHRSVEAFTVQDQTEVSKSKRRWVDEEPGSRDHELEFWKW